MIQRIQTLWLLLAVLLSVAAFFFPLANFGFEFKGEQLSAIYKILPVKTAPYQYNAAWTVLIANCITGITAFITVFLYKNRRLQMRVLAFAFLFSLAEMALIFFYQADAGLTEAVTNICKGTPQIIDSVLQNAKITYNIASYFPLIQLVFFVFAMNGIKKDEALVKSSERLR